MNRFIIFIFPFIFFCCHKMDTQKFHNYISLEGKVFKDGEKDFYPMVLNYSIDVITKKNSKDIKTYATPRSKYHPFYGNGEGESMRPWGNDANKTHAIIQKHLHNIRRMGFNTIRLTGFSTTDTYGGFHTWDKLDVSNSSIGNHNIKHGIIPLLKILLECAENADLRVILLISAIENQPKNQHNYYRKIAKSLANEKALLAYDIYNEPVYFDRGKYNKYQTYNFVKKYSDIFSSKAPKHLTTIGLTHYKIVYEWDMELMDVDFISIHAYPYWSKNLSLLERFESKLYWMSKNISKPWIVGETGLNTMTECDPLNLASGTISDQLFFMKYSLEAFRSAGASGYSWWNYQDTRIKLNGDCPHWDHYGLISSTKHGKIEDGYVGTLKHAIEDLPFQSFLNESPYKNKNHSDIKMPPKDHYYNIDYLPSERHATGKIVDEFDHPVEDAIITLYNPISKAQYSTFSKPDGTFDLKTGWTSLSENLYFMLRVTAVKKETIERAIIEVYNGTSNRETKLQDITLYDFKFTD